MSSHAEAHQHTTEEVVTDLGNGAYSVGTIAPEGFTDVRRTACPNAPTHEVPASPSTLTVAELVAHLKTLGGTKDADFAASLVAYYERTGSLSDKQQRSARRIYRRFYDAKCWLARRHNHQHNYAYTGKVVHYANDVLGTWAHTLYYRCTLCDGWTGVREEHNYSGD